MEVPASNRTKREKRADSGSDRSDFPTFLSFLDLSAGGAKFVIPKNATF
jgi:hypothetical protein